MGNIITIIVTHNGSRWIYNCINSILNSNLKIDIICIDNFSTDDTVDVIKSNFSDIIIIENNENLGFGQANNIGLRYAIKNYYDYIFLLNQDAYVENDTIYKLVQASKNNLEFGILSPIHLNGEGNRLDLNFSNYISEYKCGSFISDFILAKLRKEVYDLPFVNAAAWLLPLNTIKTIGGFDPLFFHYGEDDNYCQRVLYHGLKIGIVPDTYVFHDRSQLVKKIDRYENLVVFEKSFKVKCANVNESFQKNISWEIKEIKKKFFISFLSFNIFGFLKWFKFYSHVKSIIPHTEKSRKINEKIGSNYLNG
ncbi:glycosyltransferase family 2 protein [Algoriphagus hitonicola]|uniref:Glycosyltransferase, GT2 family n=1 Tax=Algoriphagus hitonicola TaxID=435880 RepID=A0A1I2TG57_9BACT|nr:glycosyltransferase family 2 protein [Algoriphagus hitonicola]SFG63894.1 Glycosyltransferase, GT2 family [Algoriphagus hitonicola]